MPLDPRAAEAADQGTGQAARIGELDRRVRNLEGRYGPLQLPTYTTTTLPAAASFPGCMVYVSNATAGSKVQVSDGTLWVAVG